MHSHPEAADTLIVGAQLYDGTGAPPVARDVAIRNGLIAAIGNLSNWLAGMSSMRTAARSRRASSTCTRTTTRT